VSSLLSFGSEGLQHDMSGFPRKNPPDASLTDTYTISPRNRNDVVRTDLNVSSGSCLHDLFQVDFRNAKNDRRSAPRLQRDAAHLILGDAMLYRIRRMPPASASISSMSCALHLVNAECSPS